MPRLALLASGSGTLLEAFLDSGVPIAVVMVDRPCRARDVATSAGVPAELLDRNGFGGFSREFDRRTYSQHLAARLAELSVDLVAMAGFGTVLDGEFFDTFGGRVLNTHPSLLPDFKGWHAVAAALSAGVSETGCTVHVATPHLDDGPVLAQRRVPVEVDDDEATLHERIKRVEREIYPRVVTRALEALARGDAVATVAEVGEEPS